MKYLYTLILIFLLPATIYSEENKKSVDTSSATTSSDGMLLGDLKIFQIKGKANMTLGKKVTALKRGQIIHQGCTVETDKLSNVVFMLSNGTTANVGANSKMDITQFEQKPFDKTKGIYTRLKKDPSKSLTHLYLHHGEVLLSVKKLQGTSVLDLETPIGSAGVRGTTYHTSYGVNKLTGNPLMAVANMEGEVIIESQIEIELVMSDNSVSAGKYNPYVGPKLYEIPEKSIVLLEADPEFVPSIESLPVMTPVSDYKDFEFEDVNPGFQSPL